MRRSIAICAIVPAGLLGLTMLPMGATVLAGGSSKNCEEKLVDKRFQCKVVFQNGTREVDDVSFTSPGTLGDFDLAFPDPTFGCSCRAAGNINDPEFDQDEDGFLCAGTFIVDVGTLAAAFVGKLTDDGKFKMEEFQTLTGDNSALYRCKKQR